MSTLASDTVGGGVDEAPAVVPSSTSGVPLVSGRNTSGNAEPRDRQETNSKLPAAQETKTVDDELRDDSAAAVQPEKTEGADESGDVADDVKSDCSATTQAENKDSAGALAPDTSHVPPTPPTSLVPGKRGPKETFADFL